MVPWGPSIAEARHGGPSILSLVNLLELGELGHVQMKDVCSELSSAEGGEIAPAPKPVGCCRSSEGLCTLLCSYIPLCTSAPRAAKRAKSVFTKIPSQLLSSPKAAQIRRAQEKGPNPGPLPDLCLPAPRSVLQYFRVCLHVPRSGMRQRSRAAMFSPRPPQSTAAASFPWA